MAVSLGSHPYAGINRGSAISRKNNDEMMYSVSFANVDGLVADRANYHDLIFLSFPLQPQRRAEEVHAGTFQEAQSELELLQ